MEKAGAAMKQIHGKLNIDTVDETMYVVNIHRSTRIAAQPLIRRTGKNSEKQHALGEEIANAITSAPIGDPVDEDELNEELDALEQEQLDNKTAKNRHCPPCPTTYIGLPAAANGESECCRVPIMSQILNITSQGQGHPSTRKRTRRKSCGNYRRRWQCRTGPQNWDYRVCDLIS